MKIKINIQAKTIEVEGKINRTELNKVLTNLFPAGKTYHIVTVSKISHWVNPVVYNPDIPLKIGEFNNIYNVEI